MKALMIDLYGTHANCAIVEDRKIICSQTIATDGATDSSALTSLTGVLKGLIARTKLPLNSFAGIAVGFCGLVNPVAGRVISTNAKYQDAPNLHLQEWAREQLGLTLYLENDTRMALLGEWDAGAAVGFDAVVMVTLGTGLVALR